MSQRRDTGEPREEEPPFARPAWPCGAGGRRAGDEQLPAGAFWREERRDDVGRLRWPVVLTSATCSLVVGASGITSSSGFPEDILWRAFFSAFFFLAHSAGRPRSRPVTTLCRRHSNVMKDEVIDYSSGQSSDSFRLSAARAIARRWLDCLLSAARWPASRLGPSQGLRCRVSCAFRGALLTVVVVALWMWWLLFFGSVCDRCVRMCVDGAARAIAGRARRRL